MPEFVLNSLYNNTYVKLAIGYEASPGASTIDTDAHEPSPFGSWGAEALTAALVESNDGSMNLPALFCMKAYGILVVNAYANSTYPIVFCVPFIAFATPSLPGAPIPVGHGTDFAFPTCWLHCGLTLDK